MRLPNKLRDSAAASGIEYGLLVGLIALGAVGAVAATGTEIKGLFGIAETQVAIIDEGAGDPAGEDPGSGGPIGDGGGGDELLPTVSAEFDVGSIGNGESAEFSWSASDSDSIAATARYLGNCTASSTLGNEARAMPWSTFSGTQSFTWNAEVAGCSEEICVTGTNIHGATPACATVAYTAIDNSPDNLVFESLPSDSRPYVEPYETIISDPVTLTGFDGEIAVTVTNGAVARVDESPVEGSITGVTEGTRIELWTDAAGPGETVTMVVIAGGATTTWNVTASDYDHTPNGFYITEDEYLEPGVEYDTAEATTYVEGISEPVTLTILTPGAWFTHYGDATWLTSGQVQEGDELVFKTTAPETFATEKEIEVQVGDLSYTWRIKTRDADTEPFIEDPEATTGAPNTLVESTPITVSEFDGQLVAMVSSNSSNGAEVRVNSGSDWSSWSTSVQVSDGDEVMLRTTAGPLNDDEVAVTININGVTKTWIVTTAANPLGSYTFATVWAPANGFRQTEYVNLPGTPGTDVQFQLVTAQRGNTNAAEYAYAPQAKQSYTTFGTYAASGASEIGTAPAGSPIRIEGWAKEDPGNCRDFIIKVDGHDWGFWKFCTY